MIEHAGWIKSLSALLKAVFDRLALRIGRRKPKLYAHFQPGLNVWCIARDGPGADAAEYMQVVFQAILSHDDPAQALFIVDAYLVGRQLRSKR